MDAVSKVAYLVMKMTMRIKMSTAVALNISGTYQLVLARI